MFIYPAHVLKGVTGDAYIKRIQLQDAARQRPVSRSAEQDVERAADHASAGGTTTGRRTTGGTSAPSNFDEIQQIVVRDRNLEFEMFKRGDIDYYFVQRAQNGSRS